MTQIEKANDSDSKDSIYSKIAKMNSRIVRIMSNTAKIEKENYIKKFEQAKNDKKKEIAEKKRINEQKKKQLEALNRNIKALDIKGVNSPIAHAPATQTATIDFAPNKKIIIETKTEEVYETTSTSTKGAKKQPVEIKSAEPTEPVIVIEDKSEIKPAYEKPTRSKNFYEERLEVLEKELQEAEKDLKDNNREYLPLVRIKNSYERNYSKLQAKEMSIARQKVSLYGVRNNANLSDAKKQKIDNDMKVLEQLKDTVYTSEQIIRQNKDRFPELEKNNKLIKKHIKRLNDDIASVKHSLNWFDNNENN